MIQIRKSIFETNSSSVHAICIAYGGYDLPNFVKFKIGEYGWGYDILSNMHDKANYLYTALWCNDRFSDIDKLKEILAKDNIDYEFEDLKKLPSDYGYIDHGYMMSEFLDDIMSDSNRLFRYLFSENSFIIIGNDNDEESIPTISVPYFCEEYRKYN